MQGGLLLLLYMDGLKVAEAIARKYSIPSSDADKNS